MKTGITISAAGHGLLIAVVLFGGLLAPEELPQPTVADVSVMTEEEFAALTRRPEGPAVNDAPPEPGLPEIVSEDAPDPETPAQDTPPEVVAPAASSAPDAPDETPVRPEPLAPEAEVSDAPPDAPAPPPSELEPQTDLPPVQRPSPRIAPEAAAPPPPDVDIAPEVVERSTPDPVQDAPPAPDEPPTAPDEAATEIVTEADRPAGAPESSVRPAARPARPAPRAAEAPQETQETQETQASPEPATQPPSETTPEPAGGAAEDIPRGPRMTGAETDAFRIAVSECWVVDSGSEASRITVTVGFSLTREGRVEGDVRRLSASEGSATARNAAFEAARRAVLRCGARGYDLPVEKYGQWREVEITFDPEAMRLR